MEEGKVKHATTILFYLNRALFRKYRNNWDFDKAIIDQQIEENMPTGYDNKAKDDSPVNKSTRGNKSKTNAQTGKIIKVKSSMKKSDVETKSAAG